MDDLTLARLCGLAENPALPTRLLDRLIATADRRVLRWLAWREDLTPEQRHALPQEDVYVDDTPWQTDPDIERAYDPATPVAERTALPADVFTQLLADEDVRVVKGVAPHPAATADQLWALAEKHGTRLFPRLARNPHCPPDLPRYLARNARSVTKTYREIAKHPDADADAETLLLCLSDSDARRWVAAHPNVPADILVEMLEDPRVAATAAANPALPVSVMARLVGLPDAPR